MNMCFCELYRLVVELFDELIFCCCHVLENLLKRLAYGIRYEWIVVENGI